MANAHAHSSEEQHIWYLDQLMSIALCGALAGVTIALWYTGLLNRMLHEKFHIWVLGGGVVLLLIVVIRAIAVWRSVDATVADNGNSHGHSHGHDHDHPHDHSHDHPHEHGPGCGHEHAPGEGSGHIQTPPAPATGVALPGGAGSLARAATVAAPPHSHGSELGHSHAHGVGHTHGHTHSHGDGHEHGWAPWRYVVLLLPIVLYFLVLSNPAFDTVIVFAPGSPIEHIRNFINIFRSIVWEAMPFIVLGAVIAGLLEELLPQTYIARILPRNTFLAICLGGLLGLPFPMCECGIIPVMRRLLRKGLPLSCCVAYLLAGPIINVVVLMSTWFAFSGQENLFEGGQPSYQMGGWWMMGFRAGLGYLVAIGTALIVEGMHRKSGDALLTPLARPGQPMVEDEVRAQRPLGERISNIAETALHDFVDIMVFLILGALLAAGARLFLSQELVADLSREHVLLSIVLMMVLAVVLCLCSEADAFVAASFATLRPASKLAFLVLGPMLDFKLYMMYTRVFRPKLIWTIFGSVIIQTLLYSYAVHFVWERFKEDLVTPVKVTVDTNLGSQEAASDGTKRVSFVQLESAAASPEGRNLYQDPTLRVRVVGQYIAQSVQNVGKYEQRFMLVRYRMNCCAADAVPIKVLILVDPDIKQFLPSGRELDKKWVQVRGRVQFIEDHRGVQVPALILERDSRISPETLIEEVPADPNPYIY
jgi:uncharacterized membrane protein YraQ (UPF0718 family)